MSKFIETANRTIDEFALKIKTYGTSYAMARATGHTPWESCSMSADQEKDLPLDTLQSVRARIDALLPEVKP